MDFKKLNNIGGWISFIIALVVYTLTVESSVSLWDCGEFLSAAYKLQVVHPPGAPFFLLLGRIFSLFAFGNEANVAFWVNMLSAVSSAACVMFTFWITTYFAAKLVNDTNDNKTIIVLGAGLVAALTNTFIDTFWFSAVEAEVYALSSFFTAISFWALVRWEASSSKHADRWLIFIAFLVGLGLGTHMLNLLIIPVAGLAVYFKHKKNDINTLGLIKALVASAAGLMFVMKFIYPGIPWLMSRFDYFFVNSLGLPFYSGTLFSILVIIGLAWAAIHYTRNNYNWNLMAVSAVFVVLGYSSYAMVIVRSLANPAIDMNDPEDPYRYYGYITREQYGERPLMYGPFFNSEPVDTKEIGQKYFKGKDKYEDGDMKFDYVYDPSEQIMFPRMGATGRPNDDVGYRLWGGMDDVQNQISELQQSGGNPSDIQSLQAELPTMGNNLQFFWNYQMGHMYMRYFLWNFAGRFNDQQKMTASEIDGSWYSGLPFVDYFSTGSLDGLPDFYKNQKGKNAYYMLPLLLGILGMVVQYRKNKNGFLIILALFLFTGVLINVYLNPPPFEPRERDYSLVGSFQTFCIWVGLGVVMLAEFLRKYLKGSAAITAAAASLVLVPVNMGYQNWDDHNRSDRYIGKHSAQNFLETLDKNAILICNGDNDTYPLWYLQNVEGVRTDVRIINMSLLPTEWYSSVLLDKVMDSEPLPLTLTKENLEAGSMDNGIRINKGTMDMRAAINECLKTARNTNGCFWPATTVSFKSFKEQALAAGIIKQKDMASAVDSIVFSVSGNYITKGDVLLYDFIENNARNGWKRPLYFTSVSGFSFNGLNNYLRLEGMVYKFVPINGGSQGGRPNGVDKDMLYANLIKNYKYYGIKENPNFFLDDKASYVISQMKNWALEMAMNYGNEIVNYDRYKTEIAKGASLAPPAGFSSAAAFVSQKGSEIEQNRKKGLEILNKIRTEIAEPQVIWTRNDKADFALAYLILGDRKSGEKLLDEAVKDLKQFHGFYDKRLPSAYEKSQNREVQINYQTANNIISSLKNYGMNDLLTKYEAQLKPMVDLFKRQ